MEVLKGQHPDSTIHITVADETDPRGMPLYTYTVTPGEAGQKAGRLTSIRSPSYPAPSPTSGSE